MRAPSCTHRVFFFLFRSRDNNVLVLLSHETQVDVPNHARNASEDDSLLKGYDDEADERNWGPQLHAGEIDVQAVLRIFVSLSLQSAVSMSRTFLIDVKM